jgi:YbgC/YbaW family acyl-CoA thioester hydrolase
MHMAFTMTIAWGDCDAAGIVFYPQFFRWLDTSFHQLLSEKALDHRTLVERFGIIGTPIADAGARFIRPATFGDTIAIHTQVSEWHEKMFRVGHRIMRGDETICEGHELRFWGKLDPDTGRLRASPIAPQFRHMFDN